VNLLSGQSCVTTLVASDPGKGQVKFWCGLLLVIHISLQTSAWNTLNHHNLSQVLLQTRIPTSMALYDMLPANEISRRQQVLDAAHDNRVVDLSSEFVSAYKEDTFKPRIHAELLVLEHFYQNNLDFANGERYIGCSKPSCDCCDLYMKRHPDTFITRATHGNLWTNWRPPSLVNSATTIDKHTRDILNEMVKHIRKAALNQILLKLPQRQRMPDSATGISV
jgi:hypothetical protein